MRSFRAPSTWADLLARVPRPLRFIGVGALNTLFGYAAFLLLLAATRSPILSISVATPVSVAFNFFTSGRIVFGSTDRRCAKRFIAAYGLVYAVNVALLVSLEACGVGAAFAQAALIAPLAALAYRLQRDFVFSERHGLA